ncbi:SDR family NAD(P)-dependent oxidoreductase [Pseudonocardia sp. ICBG601]|uniref:SDR family NAD(P)-dependent oxidoreductase n=1 Tax=Pseudonocardia sp. ICBG601 TaxID=2846759 RepID=UPI001CF7008C|nr:SDR family NAD(P)-dependent oxidoreductase [Pseudonocardia sp. ICBG601]
MSVRRDEESPVTERPVWFVTGAGRGLGRALTQAALAAGERVVATVRRADALADLRAEFPSALHVATADVRDRDAVRAAVSAGVARFGHLDVVVNNAGYGLVGAVEEVGEAEARDIVDTNLLGPLWVAQAVLPHLRARGAGHIVQISTTGAVGAMPTLGLYNAGKWGLEGFSQALAGEVSRFGIRVTVAQLGGFDTDWAGPGMHFATPSAGYDDLRRELFGTAEVPWHTEGPLGAPVDVAVEALRRHVAAPDGPFRLLVGADAPGQVTTALRARCEDYAGDSRFTWPAPDSTGAHPSSQLRGAT